MAEFPHLETKTWHDVDKSTWGDGPWQDEPDLCRWRDAATGLPCVILRAEMGHLCGYVGLPPGHRLWGWDPLGGAALPLDVKVHWGPNFGQACGEPAGCGWVHPADAAAHHWFVGFDCGHASDVSPASAARMREVERALPALAARLARRRPVYRPLAYVQAQCTHLAAQLARLEVIGADTP